MRRAAFGVGHEIILRWVTARHFAEGFTILDTSGAWQDPTNGRYRKEEARLVIICTGQPRKLGPRCRALGKALRQKENLVIESGTVRRFRIPARRRLLGR